MPLELSYADNLVIVAKSFDELKMRLKDWKEELEVKGPNINIGKTKVICSRYDASIPRSHLSNSHVEYAGKVLELTQSSV